MSLTRLPIALLCWGALEVFSASDVQAGAREEVIAAFQAATSAASYRMLIETESRRGTVSTQLDVQLPGRFHMKAAEAEFVIVPEGTWINVGGSWTQVPIDMSQRMQGFRIEDIEQAAGQLTEVERIGDETINGCANALYRYLATNTVVGRASNDRIELAICEASGLPSRLRTEPQKQGEAVTIHYDFAAAIEIRAPK